MTRWLSKPLLFAVLSSFVVSPLVRSEGQPTLSREQMETFLKTAKILKTKSSGGGTTGTIRATLSDGTLTHDAHVQSIDESKLQFHGDRGTTELNFRDTYKFNIAAYRLSLLLGMDNIPMSVERSVNGKTSAVTWWIDDIQFNEAQRLKNKTQPPDADDWNKQMFIYRTFDQLVYNTDSNLDHAIVDKNWKIWKIDHSRSFRLYHNLLNAKNLTQIDTNFLAKMKELNEDSMTKELRPFLTKDEIKAVLARRDVIVKFFEDEVKQKGEAAVLYTYARK
jgi:hypothetical protein